MEAVLLKIKRQFSHDEAVTALQLELSKANFRNGELVSENEELRHRVGLLERKVLQQDNELAKPQYKLTKQDLLDKKFDELTKSIKKVRSMNVKVQKDVNIWRSMYLNLAAKYGV